MSAFRGSPCFLLHPEILCTQLSDTIIQLECCLVWRYVLFFDVGAKFQHILLAGHFELVGEPEVFHLNLQERKEMRDFGHLEENGACCLEKRSSEAVSKCFWPQLILMDVTGMLPL